MNMMEEMKISSESPFTTPPLPTMSFSSLPSDLALNCLARISKFHHPTLSLVSKTFRSLITSPDLDTIRSRIGITEKNLFFVCLDLNINPDACWFILSPIPNQKLIPIPPFPDQKDTKSASFISSGSKIYMIGGLVNGKRSKRVFLLDFPSHEWRTLPEMHVPRESAAVDVIDGKIYVVGGSGSDNSQNWGEVYDPKTQIWEPLTNPTTTLKGTIHGLRLMLGAGKWYLDEWRLDYTNNACFVEIDKVLCELSVCGRVLAWNDPNENDLGWRVVLGLEVLEERLFPSHYFPYYLTSNTFSGGGGRVTVWWTSVFYCYDQKKHKTEVWCAEVSFERRSSRVLWGFLEWSKKVFTFDGYYDRFEFMLPAALVTH